MTCSSTSKRGFHRDDAGLQTIDSDGAAGLAEYGGELVKYSTDPEQGPQGLAVDGAGYS